MKDIVIYKGLNNETQVDILFDNNSLWLNQKQIAQIFGTEVPAINKHIKNIIKDLELQPEATISKMETVQIEGTRKVSRTLDYYNLDMIISIGYRVNSGKATQLRSWAT